MGAVTVAITKKGVEGGRRFTEGTITMSTSYVSGGDTIDLDTVGLETRQDVDIRDYKGYSFHLSGTNVVAFSGAGTQVASGADLSALVPNFKFSGYGG